MREREADPGALRAAAPAVTLGEITLASAWNVQGARAVELSAALFGLALVDTPNRMTAAGAMAALWLGPASWLVVSGTAPRQGFHARRDALNAVDAALFDLSAGRVAFAVRGQRAGDVLAAGCPLDLHPESFPEDGCAQSVLGRVNALYCRPAMLDGFVVMVARSFGRDVWHGLRTAAAEYGYEEVAPAPWPGDASG